MNILLFLEAGFDLSFKTGAIDENARWQNFLQEDLSKFTVSIWLKTDAIRDDMGLISYATHTHADNSITFAMPHSKTIVHLFSINVYEGSTVLNDGKWHHVAFSWESAGGRLKVFEDGKKVHESTGGKTGTKLSKTGVLYIGEEQDSVGGGLDAKQSFIGMITGFNVWDRVLPEDELIAVKNQSCHSRIEGNVISWYKDVLPATTQSVGIQSSSDACSNSEN